MRNSRSRHALPPNNRIVNRIQIGLVGLMALTGFEIHSAIVGFGFKLAITLHAYVLIGLLIFYLCIALRVLTISAWKRRPSKNRTVEVNFPGRVIENLHRICHPIRSRIYISIASIVLVYQLMTGILYLTYNHWSRSDLFPPLRVIAYAHTCGGFAISVCLIIHIYLSYLSTRTDQKYLKTDAI